MLLLADRGFFSFALWRRASATRADLLWRVRTDAYGPTAQHVRDLDDGSWLAHLRMNRPGFGGGWVLTDLGLLGGLILVLG